MEEQKDVLSVTMNDNPVPHLKQNYPTVITLVYWWQTALARNQLAVSFVETSRIHLATAMNTIAAHARHLIFAWDVACARTQDKSLREYKRR